MTNESKLVTIKEAARMLGVVPLTLRNWDKSGKLKALRHPLNNYRVYKRSDIEKLIEDISTASIDVQARKPQQRSSRRSLIVKHID